MPPTSPAPELLFSPGLMRAFLFLGQLAMILLALVFLRRRQLSLFGYLKWGLLAILVPLVGPFLVIYTRPGKPVSAPASSVRGPVW
jgi:hypothetical protein